MNLYFQATFLLALSSAIGAFFSGKIFLACAKLFFFFYKFFISFISSIDGLLRILCNVK